MKQGYSNWLLWIVILAVLLRIGAAFYLGDTLEGEQQQRSPGSGLL